MADPDRSMHVPFKLCSEPCLIQAQHLRTGYSFIYLVYTAKHFTINENEGWINKICKFSLFRYPNLNSFVGYYDVAYYLLGGFRNELTTVVSACDAYYCNELEHLFVFIDNMYSNS